MYYVSFTWLNWIGLSFQYKDPKNQEQQAITNHTIHEHRETHGGGMTIGMQSCTISGTPILTFQSPFHPTKQFSRFPISVPTKLNQTHFHLSQWTALLATLKSPRGFGPSQKTTKKQKKKKSSDYKDEDGEGIIPEVVTNRMIKRMGLSIGIPLFAGLVFFPFFYYLKMGLKIDVPTCVPFIVSFFGSALLGVSYGIVSSSWDPMREGSLLGWNEAQKNCPVFWRSLWCSRSDRMK